jgi:hypothetical protein
MKYNSTKVCAVHWQGGRTFMKAVGSEVFMKMKPQTTVTEMIPKSRHFNKTMQYGLRSAEQGLCVVLKEENRQVMAKF